MTVPARPTAWRVLAVFCGAADDTGCGAVQELLDLPSGEAEVHIMRAPSLAELGRELVERRPNFLYLSSGIVITGDGSHIHDITLKPLEFRGDDGKSVAVEAQQLVETIGNAELDTVFFDAKFPQQQAEALRAAAVRHVVHWDDAQPAPALIAAFAGKAFFAMLRNSTATAPEAAEVAREAAQVHCLGERGGKAQPPILPVLLSPEPAELPDNASVPPPLAPHLDLSNGILAAVPGWAHVRLLAPHADLRLLVCGQSTLVDKDRLGHLGEALRALLVLEARGACVITTAAPERAPAYLPAGCEALKCALRTPSGGRVSVLLGAPPEVLKEQALVEHALRHTLVADALALQLKLPAAGAPATIARSSAAVACGTPVVETLASTSLWAVTILKTLAQDSGFRGLVALGVAAVGGAAVAAFTEPDSALHQAVIDAKLAGGRTPPVVPLTAPPAGTGGGRAFAGPASISAASAPVRPFAPLQQAGGAADGGRPSAEAPAAFSEWTSEPGAAFEGIVDWSTVRRDDPAEEAAILGGAGGGPAPRTSSRQPALSNRPPLAYCSEREFLDDVCAFLSDKRGKALNPEKFPEAILNGAKLDLFALYKEVVSRGGYKLGNGINWKSQVFTQMRNWTQVNNMTGVGNALKRHYQVWLLDYEQAHPEDVTGDLCSLCGGAEDAGGDWISCDECQSWVHFSCDPRAKAGELGAWRDYAQGEGSKHFICYHCHEADAGDTGGGKRQKSAG